MHDFRVEFFCHLLEERGQRPGETKGSGRGRGALRQAAVSSECPKPMSGLRLHNLPKEGAGIRRQQSLWAGLGERGSQVLERLGPQLRGRPVDSRQGSSLAQKEQGRDQP